MRRMAIGIRGAAPLTEETGAPSGRPRAVVDGRVGLMHPGIPDGALFKSEVRAGVVGL